MKTDKYYIEYDAEYFEMAFYAAVCSFKILRLIKEYREDYLN